jgi:hypothetical protein
MTRVRAHPDWCGQSHVCGVERPGGEHRSHPLTLDTATTRLVLTRTRTRHGHDRMEIRILVDLPADPHQARDRARRLVRAIHHAIHHAVTRAQAPGCAPAGTTTATGRTIR